MRTWHRRLSIFVGLFMLLIALTGALLQVESLMEDDHDAKGPPGAASKFTDDEVKALLASALAGARRQTQGSLLGIELRLSAAPVATVVVAEPQLRKLRLDARTGNALDTADAGPGGGWHGVLLDLHRGTIAGSVGLWISLVCGLVLAVLSVTGLTLYIQLYLRRRANKQPTLVW